MKVALPLVVCLLLISSHASSQIVRENMNLMGAGARALGMGGAFIAVSDDATAASWNPAGLAQLKKGEASGSGKFVKESWEEDDPDIEPIVQNHATLNFASIAYPIAVGPKNLVAAVCYQRQIETYGKINTPEDPANNSFEGVRTATGGYDTFSPALGFQVTPEIMVGGTVNIWRNGTLNRWEGTGPNEGYWEERNIEISGTNLLAGVLYQSRRLSYGAIVRSTLNLSRTVTYTDAGGTEDSFDMLGIKLPAMVGFGVAFRPSSELLLAADVDVKPYSDAKQVDPATDEETDAGFEDITQVRAGVEYLLQSGEGFVPIRLGVRTDPKTYTSFDTRRADNRGEQVIGKTYSAGLGFFKGNLSIDVVYEFSTAEIDNFYGGSFHTVTETAHALLVSVIAHFGR
ncbi:MAG: hypothetical protein QME66_11595 [Candidatus Eisenbacteria bacterium]|nr:hypothetical protein [Candidatus Eisenbacteria bacterium]